MEFKLKEFNTAISVTKMANIHYFEFTNKYFTSRDNHPFKELVYVDSGKIAVDSDNFNGILSDKEFLIHKANESHSLSCIGSEAPNVIIIGFECECPQLDVFSSSSHSLSPELIKILTEIVKEGRAVFLPPYDVPNLKDMKKRENYPFGADQMLKLKLEIFLIELVRSISSPEKTSTALVPDKKTEEIYNYINNNYSEKITLDNLCFIFGINKTTLCRSFKEAYNETIISYINRVRIKKAKKLMREGELNLTQLSSKVGFSSIHYFSKIFKIYEQKSPTAYIDTIKSHLDAN